ncbi:hypothetical protein M0C63_004365 [Escherichia coli]|nr:hypothetical protein [Escherichia coli]
MDEQITLTQNQIFSASLKVSKSRSLVKRRMQSLGLKFTESQDVRNRLAGIEKGALKCVGQFCHDNDAESLSAMAIILSELFLLQGELSTSNEYGDHETSYWTVAQGPCDEWVQSLLASENGRRTFNSFRITFDNSEERRSLVEKNAKMLGSYLLPYFVNFTNAASAFITLPNSITFKQVQRNKPLIHPETTLSHILTIEDSAFLSRIKFKLISAIDRLPDPSGQYANMFNHIMDRALLTHLNREQIDSPCVCKKVISTYADTMLTLPIFNTTITGKYRHWTPWGINFVEFSRQTAKEKSCVYVPEPGQIHWKSPEHKELAEYSLINQIIPQQYHWLLGVPTIWRSHYRDHSKRLDLFKEWRDTNGCG